MNFPCTEVLGPEGRSSMVEIEEKSVERAPFRAPAPSITAAAALPAVGPGNTPSPWWLRRTAPALACAVVLGMALVVVGVTLCAQNWTRGYPWTPRLLVLAVTLWCSALLAMGVGLWWWRRAPANPTGLLLYLAGIGESSFMISASWPSAWAQLPALVTFLQIPCLAWIVFGWPTGRPSRRLRTAVIVYGVSVAAVFQVGFLFTKSLEPSAEWPDPWQAVLQIPQVWYLMDAFQALVLNAVPAIATIIWLVRRRRAVPAAVRPLITPITVAGIFVAGSLVLVHLGFQVFGSLFAGDENDISAARMVVLISNYFLPGFVAIGVLVGATRRQRAVAVGTRQLLIDLRSATPVISPSAAAAALVGDQSATVRYRAADGRWVDSDGAVVAEVGQQRRLLPVLDSAGQVTAGLEVDAATPIPPLLADLAVSAIAARAANERAAALADARRRDVRARSRELVAATDAGRIALERNLHDGAQQLLVGLALTAGLRARESVKGMDPAGLPDTTAGTVDLLEQIDRVRREVLELVDAATPAALSAGLASALSSLAAVCPIATTVQVAGDVNGDDPMALGLYLAAGEAITNAVKHSRATGIQLTLVVDDEVASMTVQDKGIGGVPQVPPSIGGRIARMGGHADVDSPVGVGTLLQIRIPRSRTGGDAS